jgi:RNA polymerase sigma-70 factor (ECF subfamily)
LPDPETADEALLQAIGRGDLAAFAELVNRHQAWAWRIAWRFLGEAQNAEDVVQEAFLRVHQAAARYDRRAAFRTYFYRIITRLCLDCVRKKRPVYLDSLPDEPDPAPDAAEIMIQRQRADAVRAALDSLPPNQRMAVVLRYDEGLDYRQIAAALETSPKAVERLLSRARDRLRSLLLP